MKRLSINEIKSDIRNGYNYLEDEMTYCGGNLLIIVSSRESSVLIHYERDNYETTYKIDYDQFMAMSRKEFNKLFNANLFYNMQAME